MNITRHSLTSIVLSATLAATLNAQSASDKPEKVLHKITVEKLEAEILKTPRFSFSGPRIASQPENKGWLEIQAKLKIETKSKLDFLPSLDATFHVVTKGKKEFVRSEKTITFKNINIESGEAWVSAYIDPDTLRVITKQKKPKTTDVTGIAVTIDSANLYKGKEQKFLPYGEEIFDRSIIKARKNAKNKNTRWWKSVTKSEQKILALEETPFYTIYIDSQPLEKRKNTTE